MPATRHARRTFGRASDVALLRGFRDRNPARSISASASAHGCRVARSANWASHRVVADNLIRPRASSWGSSHKNERANCQENDVSIPYFQLASQRLAPNAIYFERNGASHRCPEGAFSRQKPAASAEPLPTDGAKVDGIGLAPTAQTRAIAVKKNASQRCPVGLVALHNSVT